MTRISLVFPVAVAALFGGHAVKAESYVSLGYGALTCSVWTGTRANRPKEAETYAAWVYGFVSAYNAYVFKGPNVVEGTDAEGLRDWVDAYCKANVTENLDDAAKALIAVNVQLLKTKAAQAETE